MDMHESAAEQEGGFGGIPEAGFDAMKGLKRPTEGGLDRPAAEAIVRFEGEGTANTAARETKKIRDEIDALGDGIEELGDEIRGETETLGDEIEELWGEIREIRGEIQLVAVQLKFWMITMLLGTVGGIKLLDWLIG